MKHERQRDWPQLEYKYGVRGLRIWSDLPERVRREAEDLRTLWNAMVKAHRSQQEDYRAIVSSDGAVAEYEQRLQQAETLKEERSLALKKQRAALRRKKGLELEPLQHAYDQAKATLSELRQEGRPIKQAARERLKEQLKISGDAFFQQIKTLAKASPTYWCNTESIVNGFLTARSKALKEGAELQFKKGPLRESHFQHRFTGGGLPALKLFRDSGRVAFGQGYIRAGQETELIPCSFDVNEETLTFDVNLHRELPEGAIVKNVGLMGRQIDAFKPGSSRWKWHLYLTLEVPHEAYQVPAPWGCYGDREYEIAAIDLNWRLWEEGKTLRVAVVKDHQGRKQEIILPKSVMKRWRYKQELQAAADALLEETKAALFALPREDLPQDALSLFVQWDKVRAKGLTKLFFATAELEEYQRILQYWRLRSMKFWREMNGVTRHFLGARQHFYRETAARLCTQYRTLVIEDLKLKRMAEQEEKEPQLERADGQRFLAALSFFRADLQNAAKRRGTTIIVIDPAFSTLTCSVCGEQIAKNTGALSLMCPNSHLIDQDENACDILLQRALSQTSGVVTQQ